MQQKRYFLLLFILLTVDLWIKSYIFQFRPSLDFSFFSISFSKNTGFLLGFLSEIPAMIKSVFFISFGLVACSLYLFIMNFFRFRTSSFRLGISLLFSGFLGNIIDRVIHQGVIDYIYVQDLGVILNLADLLQVLGLLFIIISGRQELNYFFPKDEKRQFNWRSLFALDELFSRQFFWGHIILSLVILGINIVFINYTISDMLSMSRAQHWQYLLSYVAIAAFYHIVVSVIFFLLVKKISHHVKGPMVAFERILDGILKGEDVEVKLRESDSFKGVETKLLEIKKRIND